MKEKGLGAKTKIPKRFGRGRGTIKTKSTRKSKVLPGTEAKSRRKGHDKVFV